MSTDIQKITSAENALLKKLRRLKTPKGREEAGLFLAEGERLVREICPPWQLEYLLVSESYGLSHSDWPSHPAADGRTRRILLPDPLFASLCDTEHPQGILAVVRSRTCDAGALYAKKQAFLVMLERLQDPGNAGTILRTADAAGADGLIVSRDTVDFFSPKVVRASMGSIFHIPVITAPDLSEAIRTLQSNGVKVYATRLQASVPHYEADLGGAVCLVIGNEGSGLSEEVAGLADGGIRIPQPGRAESLNASVAAGIVIYETLRQRSL